MDQSIKVDERLAKGLVTFHMDNIKLVDGDFALVIKPKDPKNMYELATKVQSYFLLMTQQDLKFY